MLEEGFYVKGHAHLGSEVRRGLVRGQVIVSHFRALPNLRQLPSSLSGSNTEDKTESADRTLQICKVANFETLLNLAFLRLQML